MKRLVDKSKIFLQLLILTIMILLSGCSDHSKDFAAERRSVLSEDLDTITVAASGAWEYFDSQYDMWPGLELAAEHINSRGGINGRKLKLIQFDDKCSIVKAQEIARKIGDNPNITAAFVCSFANSVLSVTPLYEYFGVLTVAPVTDVLSSLLPHYKEYNLVFQTCPDTYWEAKKIIDTLKKRNMTRIIIYNIEGFGYGLELADALEAYAFNKGFSIIDHRYFAYNSNEKFFRNDLEDWKLLFDFDAIIIAGYSHNAPVIIKAARELGLKQQFITGLEGEGKSMLSPEYLQYTEGTLTVSYFDPSIQDPKVEKFIADFKKKFSTIPDGWAAQCYGSLLAFAEVVKKADSVESEKIAEVWHKTKLMPGFPAPYSYATSQKLFSKDLVLKQIKDGKFVTVGERE